MSSRPRSSLQQQEETPIIRVSEIGEYGYCSRAWWYKHVIKLPLESAAQSRLEAGTRAHQRHGSLALTSARLRAVGLFLALCGLIALGVAVWMILSP